MSAWLLLGTVESDSEPGVRHAIERHLDGRLRCKCMAFRYATKDRKTCKHILGFDETQAPGTVRTVTVPVKRVRSSEKGPVFAQSTERLTVRRAISLNGDFDVVEAPKPRPRDVEDLLKVFLAHVSSATARQMISEIGRCRLAEYDITLKDATRRLVAALDERGETSYART